MKTKPIQTALVVGAGSGMGQAVAFALAQKNIHTFVADLNEKDARKTARTIKQQGGTAAAFEVDISQSESVAELFNALKKHAPCLDYYVHTAGILGQSTLTDDISDDDWRRMMAVNLDGVFFCCREAIRWMKPNESGRIVLFSSVAALQPSPGALPYSAAKGAINMMGKTLAKELAPHNIRVNLIAPGYIQTPMLDDLPEGFTRYVLKKTPLGRLGEVQEIAHLAVYLAAPEADFFTGQIFSPNGGMVI